MTSYTLYLTNESQQTNNTKENDKRQGTETQNNCHNPQDVTTSFDRPTFTWTSSCVTVGRIRFSKPENERV